MRPQGAVTGTEWSWDLDQAGGESEPFSRICANVQDAAHVIAVAAPADAAAAQSDLEASGVPHTLLVTKDLATTKRWNLNEGIQQVVGAKRGADAAGEDGRRATVPVVQPQPFDGCELVHGEPLP